MVSSTLPTGTLWPRHATWPGSVGLGCGMCQRGVRGCRSFPEASGNSPAGSASPGFLGAQSLEGGVVSLPR